MVIKPSCQSQVERFQRVQQTPALINVTLKKFIWISGGPVFKRSSECKVCSSAAAAAAARSCSSLSTIGFLASDERLATSDESCEMSPSCQIIHQYFLLQCLSHLIILLGL